MDEEIVRLDRLDQLPLLRHYKGGGLQPLVDRLMDEFLDGAAASERSTDRVLIRKAVVLLVKRVEELQREGSPLVVRSCGEPYYLHPMRIAQILAKDKMDAAAISAGVLHSCFDIGITGDSVREALGDDTVHLVSGVTAIQDLSLHANHNTLQQADAVRKMLFAMVDDVRIILIKMADRLDRIRHIRNMESRRQRELAEEVIDIWAPLADRLGMQAEKNEFEDLSLKYSNPDVFQQIKAIVAQKKEERDAYLQNAVAKIQQKAQEAGIQCTIKSRAKHFYSIYQKMRKRGKDASKLFDLFAVRIICRKTALMPASLVGGPEATTECYTLLGIVHGLWKPLDGRFKDYIAMPKANGYQSLHTTVMCEDKPLEIQIRTEQMDTRAEHGVASHWLYKKGTNHDLVDVSTLSIFNELRMWRSEGFRYAAATVHKAAATQPPVVDSVSGSVSSDSVSSYEATAVFDRLKRDLLGNEIFVFTPKGEVIQLPEGSCAVDFAYRIHTSIGQTVVGAKADGKIIPLLQPLRNTQIIEVMTDPRAHPTMAWLKSCATARARQKIHAWLVANGVMEADERRGEASTSPRARNVKQPACKQVGNAREIATGLKSLAMTETAAIRHCEHSEATSTAPMDVIIEGTPNCLHCFAKCCHPQAGDVIVGFVSRARGVVIHRASCLVYQRIPNKENRTVQVQWGRAASSSTQ